MKNTQTPAERIQDIVKTQDILANLEHEQIKNVSNDLTKIIKTWKDNGFDGDIVSSSGFAYFLKLLAETHSIEDIKTLVEIGYCIQKPSSGEELNHGQDAYDQVADDIYACIDNWQDADICSFQALTVSLDIIATELRELLPEEDAEQVIQDYINLREGDA